MQERKERPHHCLIISIQGSASIGAPIGRKNSCTGLVGDLNPDSWVDVVPINKRHVNLSKLYSVRNYFESEVHGGRYYAGLPDSF